MKTLGIVWLVIGSVYVLCGSLCYGMTTMEGVEYVDVTRFGAVVTIGIGALHAILGGLYWRRNLYVMGGSLCVAILLVCGSVLLGIMARSLLPPFLFYVTLVIVTISAMTKQKTIEGLPGGKEVLEQITETK